MRKTILKRLTLIILTCMILTLGINLFFQVKAAQNTMIKNSQIKLNQIEKILDENAADTEQVRSELKEDYIIRAKAAAYIVQNHPEVENDLEEMIRIAQLLQVDEFHLFDRTGTIYSGTEPKYYGLTMDSGEQIGFFKQMLEDTTLALCQDVTPNTAENKLMQYVAVWSEDGERIVQIGMSPKRLLKAMAKNELSYIFSMVTPEPETVIYAVDREDGEILGCTEAGLIGENTEDIGLVIPENVSDGTGFGQKIEGVKSYCVFKTVGDQYIGITQKNSYMYDGVGSSMATVALYLLGIFLVMIFAILMQVNRVIISGIDRINEKVEIITAGNLDTVVDVSNTKEFAELSQNINSMVRSLLDTTNTLSQLFDSVDIEIGVYEYREHMNRVMVTRKTVSLLQIPELEIPYLLADKRMFEARLDEIRQYPVEGSADTYRVSGEQEQYVRIRSFEKDGSTFGMIADMTESVVEKQRIESERDSDLLTGLWSRRAFYSRMEQFFEQPEELKNAVLIMTDLDHLKNANDTYGHEFGDCLIRKAAELFKECGTPGVLPARLSGDEFALFLYGAETKAELVREIELLNCRMLEQTIEIPGGGQYPVRLSGGYVFYPECNTSFRRLMRLADLAMYQAKRKGRAGFVEYEETFPAMEAQEDNTGL